MFEKNIFQLERATLVLLAVFLVFSITSCTVECNVPALVSAIDDANANPDSSTINLDPGCTYTLTAVDNTTVHSIGGTTFEYGDNGLPQITTPITINGNNATIMRADGAPNFRVFFIEKTGSLTINDLTLQNGFADGTSPGRGDSAGSGGAIYNFKSYLEMNNSTLQNNQATWEGGAIFACPPSDTYINSSTIHDNIAPSGGGIFTSFNGLLSVDNSEISDNSASGSGGGITAAYGAELTINASLISSNHSGRHGGGIYKDSGPSYLPTTTTTITDTTIQGNTADWNGGGVFILRTPLIVSGSQFSNNQADEYGGGLGYQNESTETVLISNTTFDNNSAALDGGAIQFSGEFMAISSSTIQNNKAKNGAGIYNGSADDPRNISHADTTLTITSSTIQGNIASENGGGAFNEGIMTCGESNFVANETSILGGGIENIGELEVISCTFDKNNTGADGGGINSDNIAEIQVSTFTNNTSERGGGFSSIGGNAEISRSTFVNNSASDQGGAIFNLGNTLGSSAMSIIDCEITDNTAPFGGGIANRLGYTKMSDSTISGNKASSEGGGIYNGGLMTVNQSTLSGNDASTLGGGIHNAEEINVQDSTFENNFASADGGGLNTYGKAAVTGSTFVGNTAFRGGGLASVGGDTELTNNTFSANTATDSGGGIFNAGRLIGEATSGGAMLASHVTAAYNSAPTGGGIATSGGGVKIKNSIIALNLSGADCHTSAADFSGIGENIDTDSSCIGFTLTKDPLLDILANYGGSTDTHALRTGSPAIDAAQDCTTVSGAALSVDQRGQPRPGGPICDLGAYEDAAGAPLPQMQPCIYTAATNLFCRLGPDNLLYPVVDSFKAGQSAPVVGQSWNQVFVYVEGPVNKVTCAVPATARFGTLEGDCEDLPFITAPDVEETVKEEEEIKEKEESKTPAPSQLGCMIMQLTGRMICVVPCPENAFPGTPCTP